MLSWAYGPELTFNSELTARPGFSSVKVYGTVNPNSGLVFFALNHASGTPSANGPGLQFGGTTWLRIQFKRTKTV